ncbi:MAG: hypothetical protein AAB508_01185 [Patescibacteria group bacterium]
MKRKRGRPAQEKENTHATVEGILALLKLGVVLAVAIAAPGAIRSLQFLGKKNTKADTCLYPSSARRTVERLWRQGVVDVVDTKNGYIVRLTDKGKKLTLSYDIDTMAIQKQEEWDGKWRMVFFDIPAGQIERIMFQRKLKNLGFFQMQRSVYICPYPCEKEIKFLREVWEMPHSVKLATVERIENDSDLRRHFRL